MAEDVVNEEKGILKDVRFWVNPSYDEAVQRDLAKQLAKLGAVQIHSRNRQLNTSGRNLNEVAEGVSETVGEHDVNGFESVQSKKLRGIAMGIPRMLENEVYRFALLGGGIDNKNGLERLQGDSTVEERVTHIISKDIYFPEYTRAKAIGIKIVTEEWVEKTTRFGIRQNEEGYNSDREKHIFSGIVVTATHIPNSDREALYGGVRALGGQYRKTLVKDITHLVVMDAIGSKYEQAIREEKTRGIKVVLPHWFEQSINLGVKVDEGPYLFPDPPILKMINQIGRNIEMYNANNGEGDINAELGHVVGQDTNVRHGNQEALSETRDSSMASDNNSRRALEGYRIGLSLHQYKSLDQQGVDEIRRKVTEAGGEFIEPVVEHEEKEENKKAIYGWEAEQFGSLDVLVCQYRYGLDYEAAVRVGKLVGTLVWLEKVVQQGRFVQPEQRVFDYPQPTAPILNSGSVIAISGYSAESRKYLQNLISIMGGTYSPKLTNNYHTHLIAGDPTKIKFSKSREYNCHVINHLWLQRSYVEVRELSVSHPNFTFWPPASHIALERIVNEGCGLRHESVARSLVFSYGLSTKSMSNNNSNFDEFEESGDFSKDKAEKMLEEIISSAADKNKREDSGCIKLCIADGDRYMVRTEDATITKTTSYQDVDNSEIARVYMYMFLAQSFGYRVDRNIFELYQSLLQQENEQNAELESTGEKVDGKVVEKEQEREREEEKKEEKEEEDNMQANRTKEGEESIPDTSSDEESEYKHKSKSDRNSVAMTNSIMRRNENKNMVAKNPAENSTKKTSATSNRRARKSVIADTSTDNPSHFKRARIEEKQNQKPKIITRILFTQGKATVTQERQIKRLGGEIVSSVDAATHLISTGIKRTQKFLEALSSGRVIITSPLWLKHSIEMGEFIDLEVEVPPVKLLEHLESVGIPCDHLKNKSVNPEDQSDLHKSKNLTSSAVSRLWWWDVGYGINDMQTEAKYKFSFKESFGKAFIGIRSFNKADTSDGHDKMSPLLFSNTEFYMTPNVQPDVPTLKRLIESGGGKVNVVSSTGSSVAEHGAENDDNHSGVQIVLISSKLDEQLWSKMIKTAKQTQSQRKNTENQAEERMGVMAEVEGNDGMDVEMKIYNSEFILTGILRQQMPIDDVEFILS